MKQYITEQQSAFYTKNGFIEFAIPHKLPDVSLKRDLWRERNELERFLVKKLGPMALNLTGKKQLRLAADQWITAENKPKKPAPIQEIFCIQHLIIGASICQNPIAPEKRAQLGLLPLPSSAENILFFRTNVILDWKHLEQDIYIALFALPNAVYIHNEKDPHAHFLKELGLHFGDRLENNTHPLII